MNCLPCFPCCKPCKPSKKKSCIEIDIDCDNVTVITCCINANKVKTKQKSTEQDSVEQSQTDLK